MRREVRRSLGIVTLAILACLLLLWAAFVWVPDTLASPTGKAAEGSNRALVGLLITAFTAIFVILFKPIKERLDGAVQDVAALFRTPECRVFVFGPEGCGKTTLIRRVVALRQKNIEGSTDGFYTHSMTAPLDLRMGPAQKVRSVKLVFADYRGQNCGSVLVNPPVEFFGAPGARRVNVILFMADIFPRFVGNDNKPLTNEQIIAEHGADAKSIVTDRIQEVKNYITEAQLTNIFTAAGNARELLVVRLLINKIDLLEDLLEQGLLGPAPRTPTEYAERKYKDLIDWISSACRGLNIENRFSVSAISGRTRVGVDELITEIIDVYDTDRGRGQE